MAIYKIKADILHSVESEVEANSLEEAIEIFNKENEHRDIENLVCELSDCQYSDQQELQDEEERYGNKL